MFKKTTFHLTEPICLCLENKLVWNVEQVKTGPSLLIWCQTCGSKMQVPPDKFTAGFMLDVPYPGKPKPKSVMEVIEPSPAEVIDITEYIRKKREQEPPS